MLPATDTLLSAGRFPGIGRTFHEVGWMPGLMRAAADRNLLLGILALHMELISRDALLAAVEAWLHDQEMPLDEHLIERGALTAEHRELLVSLVEAHIRHHWGDTHQLLESLGSLGVEAQFARTSQAPASQGTRFR